MRRRMIALAAVFLLLGWVAPAASAGPRVILALGNASFMDAQAIMKATGAEATQDPGYLFIFLRTVDSFHCEILLTLQEDEIGVFEAGNHGIQKPCRFCTVYHPVIEREGEKENFSDLNLLLPYHRHVFNLSHTQDGHFRMVDDRSAINSS